MVSIKYNPFIRMCGAVDSIELDDYNSCGFFFDKVGSIAPLVPFLM